MGSIFARGRGIYYICQRKINDCFVNMEVVLNNLKERTHCMRVKKGKDGQRRSKNIADEKWEGIQKMF